MMSNFKIGVIPDSFRTDFVNSVKKAAAVGADGIQPYCTPNMPLVGAELMTKERLAEVKSIVKSEGLVFSALCGDLGKGFTNEELNPKLIDYSKRYIDWALELGTNVVTTHVGVIPEDTSCETFQILLEAGRKLAEYAKANHAFFALETGLEKAAVMKKYLDLLPTGIAVNYDPANLVMVAGDDPVQGVYTLKDYIVHTHAKDGVKLSADGSTEIHPGEEHLHENTKYKELPLGTGGVPFDQYLAALKEVGYKGFLTIEREVGENPAADIKMAADFLRARI
mgnify:CR=1 FL=1